jgi:hypothetical protein
VYGLLEMFWGQQSTCVEIEMFKRITCLIYLAWFICIVAYLTVNLIALNRRKKIQAVDEQYIEI